MEIRFVQEEMMRVWHPLTVPGALFDRKRNRLIVPLSSHVFPRSIHRSKPLSSIPAPRRTRCHRNSLLRPFVCAPAGWTLNPTRIATVKHEPLASDSR